MAVKQVIALSTVTETQLWMSQKAKEDRSRFKMNNRIFILYQLTCKYCTHRQPFRGKSLFCKEKREGVAWNIELEVGPHPSGCGSPSGFGQSLQIRDALDDALLLLKDRKHTGVSHQRQTGDGGTKTETRHLERAVRTC